MAIAPLESLQAPLDGTTASAANFGKPVADAFAGLLGVAAGAVDANNGAPLVARSHKNGLLPYSNALGNTVNPGVSPANAWSSTSAIAYQVPNGQMLVVPHIFIAGAAGTGGSTATTTINDGANTYNLCRGYTPAFTGTVSPTLPIGFPLLLDQGWIITVPQSCSFSGYSVLRDTAVTPVMRAVTTTTTYTVPAGKTLWLYGVICVGANSGIGQSAKLLLNSSAPLGAAGVGWDGTGLYNTAAFGSAISGPAPIPVAAGSILSSDQTFGVTFWGVLI